jgi:hypothetical protein
MTEKKPDHEHPFAYTLPLDLDAIRARLARVAGK